MKRNYKIIAGIVLAAIIVATLLTAKTLLRRTLTNHHGNVITNNPNADSLCNIKKLWPLTPGDNNKKKFLEIDGAGEVTFSGKVTRAGVDGAGLDCDSTFDILVYKTERGKVQSYFKQAAGYELQDSLIHCEIVCSACNDSIYAKCNCIKPKMPRKGNIVAVTGKLVIDLHHVNEFRNFELHPVERVKVISK